MRRCNGTFSAPGVWLTPNTIQCIFDQTTTTLCQLSTVSVNYIHRGAFKGGGGAFAPPRTDLAPPRTHRFHSRIK